MECPNCGFEQPDLSVECIRCGVIFSKFREKPQAIPKESPSEDVDDGVVDVVEEGFLVSLLFYVKPRISSLDFYVRVVFAVVFLIWGIRYIFMSVNEFSGSGTLFHLVNLPFHEAGHIIFRPFGRLLTSLGGTLGQLLMPIICMIVFLVKVRDTFAASFCLWWLGENFMDIAPYIDDARRLTMPLLGGNTGQTSPYGFHDWEFILTETRLLRYDHTFAWFSYKLGTVLMIAAFIWWGYLLYKQYQNLDSTYFGD